MKGGVLTFGCIDPDRSDQGFVGNRLMRSTWVRFFFLHNGPASVRLNLQIPQSSRDLNLQKVAFSSAMSVPVMSSKVAEKFVTNLTIDNEFASSSFFVTISHSSSSLMWTACSASRIWVAFDRASSILCSAASRAGS